MNINWTITQVEHQISDGLVTIAYWRCTAVEGNYSASNYGTVGFERGDTFIEYENLTEDEVLGWVKTKLENAFEIEAGLQSHIDALKNPVSATGLPW
jgi:hypothetical protein